MRSFITVSAVVQILPGGMLFSKLNLWFLYDSEMVAEVVLGAVSSGRQTGAQWMLALALSTIASM